MTLPNNISFLPTQYQEFIHKSRYARFLENENRRENWDETVDRYMDYIEYHLKHNNNYMLPVELKKELRNAIINLDVMPSMRSLMTAGKALERDNTCAYNCSYVVIDDVKAFDETMFILMCGTGVGFSVEQKYVSKLPEIPERLYNSDTTIVFKDSKEGWAKGFRQFISLLYAGEIPKVDLSKLRPKGARLKTFGGRSSGPEPLQDLLDFTVEVFKKATGRKLTSLECHDILCKIGDIVVVGGVRRSAMISLSDLTDEKMRHAKTGQWWLSNSQRALANNSAVYEEKPDVGTFIREWLALYDSKSGERGIFSRDASKKQSAKNGRRNPDFEWGTNPCSEIILRPNQFCVASDTKLITKNGIENIEKLENQNVDIWNGEEWTPVTVRKTGTNQKLMRVYLSDGSYLDCTPDHRWSVKTRFEKSWNEVQTKDLMNYSKYSVQVEPAQVKSPIVGKHINSAYTLGFAVGGGCVYDGKVLIDLYGEKDQKCPVEGRRWKERHNHTKTAKYVRVDATDIVDSKLLLRLKTDSNSWLTEIGGWSYDSVVSFFAGLADADGTETKTGGIRIYISTREMARNCQLILAKHGIPCSINLAQIAGAKTNLSIRKKDLWYLQITDCSKIPCVRLNTKNGHAARFKGKYQNIKSVELLEGTGDTYCFNEPKKHKGMFNNILTCQCNLSEVVVRGDDTLNTLKKKVELATILGTIQSTFTHFPYLRKIWKNNTEEERLLGVSMTGIMDNVLLNGKKDIENLPTLLETLKQHAVVVNEKYAKEFSINPSAAITAVKPSGCQTKDTLITTSKGILMLEEMGDITGDEWQNINFNVLQHNDNWAKAGKFYINGKQKTLKFKMKSGATLECTPNHQYQIFNGKELEWKRADALKIGNMLPYKVGGYENTKNVKLNGVSSPYYNNKKIKMPKIMNEDLAWFLGLYHADGSNHKRGIRIAGSMDKKYILEKAKKVVKKLFGVDALIYERTKCANNADLYINSTWLLSWLSLNGLLKEFSTEITIPKAIRQSSKNTISAFLDGYWNGDGGPINNSGRTYVTTSKKMAEQLLVVLRALGRDCSLREMPPTKTSWGNNTRYWIQEKKGRSGNYKFSTYKKGFEELDAANLTTLNPDYIVSIEESYNETFDIEVLYMNMYLANSYISHNTVSQLVDSASGIHARHSEYYIRTVRGDNKDPLTQFLKNIGIPNEPCVMKPTDITIFSFPVKSPEGAITRNDMSAIEQLNLWLIYQKHWCEHKPSVTITVREDEWVDVAAWVYNNFDDVSGISFLPHSDHTYKQAPYQDCSREEYEELLAKMPKIDWDLLAEFEREDSTTGSQELACVAGGCEIL